MKTERPAAEIEVYIHIPFCVKKCSYCDFLSFSAEKEQRQLYIDALKKEIGQFGFDMPVRSVFIGGGTPSVLAAGQITELLDTLRGRAKILPEAEISIEANPGTVDEDKLRAYRAAGINRISFGCQSFHDDELKMLGRIHGRNDILDSFYLARSAGFANINLDLMSAIPGQTLASWEDNLRQAIALGPEHLSAYSLILEEETPLAKNRDLPPLPDEETEREMYRRTGEILSDAGYLQYEISNYAREGYRCRHNLGYWTGVPYVGFGIGAAGFLPGGMLGETEAGLFVRYANTGDLSEYLSGKGRFASWEPLDVEERKAEFMILGLRLTEGVAEEEYRQRFGTPLMEDYGMQIEKHLAAGLLVRSGGRLFFSPDGVSVSNAVLVDFLK